jgi:hypothetical protein
MLCDNAGNKQMNNKYEVIMPEGFDERAELEMPLKGYLEGVVVVGEDGTRYPANFVDPVRMYQDMTCWAEHGRPFYAEPGLIILPDVTMKTILNAIDTLWRDGFFEHLKPWSGTKEGESES